jgi:hypothetical protein
VLLLLLLLLLRRHHGLTGLALGPIHVGGDEAEASGGIGKRGTESDLRRFSGRLEGYKACCRL